MKTLVFGHKAPDTDSTGSAIAWAWYLQTIRGEEAEAVLLGQPNTEAAFMLEYWDLTQPRIIADIAENQPVYILDTNNPAELPQTIKTADIRGIIDHHKLVGGLETKGPIEITLRPLASTATILTDLIGDDMDQTPKGIKGALLSCILSDTLAFRSPTTTAHDRDVAERLAADIDLDIMTYADAMFAAKSDVSAFSDAELLRMDSKEYAIDGTKFRVSVLETTTPASVLGRKDSLMSTMEIVAKEDGVDQVLLFVIDILKEEATLLLPNDLTRDLVHKSFNVDVGDKDTVVLPGVVSRKKQIIPVLTLT